MTKVYELPNGHRMVADIDESTMVCTITETQLDSLIRDLNYYAEQTDVLDKIRAEIIEQETSRDMEEIEEAIKCDADAEIKLKMISNIVYSKPHYFKTLKQEPCDSCEHLDEINGSNCYECVKGIRDRYDPQESKEVMRMEEKKNKNIVAAEGTFKYYDEVPALIVEGKNFEKTFYDDEARELFKILIGAKMVEHQERAEVSERNMKMREELFKAERNGKR